MKRTAIVLCMLALAACSGKPPAPQAPQQRVATPWDDMKKAEQKAKDVQKASDAQAERERKALETANQ